MENINNLKSQKVLIYQNGNDIYEIPANAKKEQIVTGLLPLRDGSKKEIVCLPENIIRQGMYTCYTRDNGIHTTRLENVKQNECFVFTIKVKKDGKENEIKKVIPVNMTKEMNVLVNDKGERMKYHLNF